MDGNESEIRSLRAELKKAEAALKRSKTKDYYKILGMFDLFFLWKIIACRVIADEMLMLMIMSGVSRDCSESEIKKAYRRQSLQHHPDKVCLFPYSHPRHVDVD